MQATLQPFDLTQVQFVLLATLAWLHSNNPVTQKDLATHARTDPMMTSQVLRTLEAKGLLRRLPHPTDARARAPAVTPEGLAVANKANFAVEAADREFFGPLGTHKTDFVKRLPHTERRGIRAVRLRRLSAQAPTAEPGTCCGARLWCASFSCRVREESAMIRIAACRRWRVRRVRKATTPRTGALVGTRRLNPRLTPPR
jgi:DNA-binding MarR family transcriptional regulator